MEKLLKGYTDREDQRMAELNADINLIKNNHLLHIEKDLAGLHVTVAAMKIDIGWVKWGVLLILGTFVTSSIALIFNFK